MASLTPQSKPDQVVVATWPLLEPPGGAPAESMLLPITKGSASDSESIFEPDTRSKVEKDQFMPGGKYRSIVKLQMRYEKQTDDDKRWAMGTGWLIRPDLLVTAGHCAYDWGRKLGRVVTVQAFIGYSGHASIDTPHCQFRYGTRVATTLGYMKSGDNQENDVSFIQVNKAFTGVTPFTFVTTPTQGNEPIGIVGYPGDKTYNNIDGGERGAEMYENYAPVKWDMSAPGAKGMLQYQISTFAGQSGSPVIRKGQNVSIGVHVYGGYDYNSASSIQGQYGNPFQAYISTFDTTYPLVQQVGLIRYVAVSGSSSIPAAPSGSSEVGEESFIDILKSVVKVGGPIVGTVLQVGTPFLGPIGAPISAIAGTALAFASKAVSESSMSSESLLASPPDAHGLAERAVMGQAALQTILQLDPQDVQESGIFDVMKSVYTKLAPQVMTIAPKLLPVVVEPALRIALDALQKANANQAGQESGFAPRPRNIVLSPSAEAAMADPGAEALIKALATPTVPVTGEEGFFDTLGDLISTGIKIGGPAVKILSPGLGMLGNLLGAGIESGMEAAPTPLDEHLQALCHRALMGEAALQALETIPTQKLATLTTVANGSSSAEGFFDSMKTTMQTIGRQALGAAPGVIKAVVPILVDALSGTKTESLTLPPPIYAPASKPAASGTKSRKSLFDQLNGNDSTNVAPLGGSFGSQTLSNGIKA